MKIVLLTAQIAFVRGGAEMHVANLKKALEEAGHQVEIVALPLYDNPIEKIEDAIVAARLLDIENSWGGHVDMAIGMKFPTYFMPHHNKVMWILHQHRQAYELFNTEYSNIKNDEEGNRIRKIIRNADIKYISEAKRVYANSQNVANRMMKYCGIKATPLYHPCPGIEKFTCGESDDYILMPSRINKTKRQMLACEAMAKSKSNIKLYILGAPENNVEINEIRKFIEENNIQDRVKFLDFVPEEEKISLYANSRGVLFIPKDEDLGYITMEGMAASKPVITARDSGGPLEFIVDGQTGFVADSSAESIAEAIDSLAADKNRAIEMGADGKQHLLDMNISWNHVVEELLK